MVGMGWGQWGQRDSEWVAREKGGLDLTIVGVALIEFTASVMVPGAFSPSASGEALG